MSADRSNRARERVIFALLKDRPDLPAGAVFDFLLPEAEKQIAFRAHVSGSEALDVAAVVEGIRMSDAGQLVFREREDAPADDKLAGLADIPDRAQRLAEARRRGAA